MTLEELLTSTIQVEPFQPLTEIGCKRCGAEPPGPIARQFITLRNHSARVFSVLFCAGSRPPVEEVRNPIEQMVTGNSEHRPVCGGVMEPHLHLTCICCGATRLMRCKS